jgi:formiminoglutamase
VNIQTKKEFTIMVEAAHTDCLLGSLITEGLDGQIVLIGFPFDEGSIRSGYRRGAELGPDCLRRFLPKVGPVLNLELKVDLTGLTVSDYGNIDVELGFVGAHNKLKEKVLTALRKPLVPRVIVIGGSADTSSSSTLGFLEYCQQQTMRPVVIAISATANLAPLDELGLESAAAFRLLLEDSRFTALSGKLKVFAAQGTHLLPSQYDYLTDHSGEVTWLREIRATHPEVGFATPRTSAASLFAQQLQSLTSSDLAYVSIDLSSISSICCPGVSRPATVGLTSEEILEIASLAGKCSAVRVVDVTEYNPAAEDWRTGRLISEVLYAFCIGHVTK